MARLSNVNLAVSDPVRSAAFYIAVLGCADTGRSAPPGFIQLGVGGVTLSLQRRDASSSAAGVGGSELGFEVADLDAARAALEANGATGIQTQSMAWGDAIDARDPDGYALTLFRLRPG